MNWRGKELTTYAEIIETGLRLEGAEQRDFVDEVEKIPHALKSIGYIAGYYAWPKAERIFEVFRTEHPDFGRRRPTADEALQAGLKLAQETRERRERRAKEIEKQLDENEWPGSSRR